MNTVSVIFSVVLFCITQIILFKKVSKKWVKYLPTAIGGAGVVIGFAIYYISYIPFLLEIQSQSVLSENQYFALMICIVFMPCLVGGLLGIVMVKFFGNKQNAYFLPFILSIIVGKYLSHLLFIFFISVIWAIQNKTTNKTTLPVLIHHPPILQKQFKLVRIGMVTMLVYPKHIDKKIDEKDKDCGQKCYGCGCKRNFYASAV